VRTLTVRPIAVRRGVLALALLALVFSPGLLARARHDGLGARPSNGDLAIALLAPTLDQDELDAARRPAWVDVTLVVGIVALASLAVIAAHRPGVIVSAPAALPRRDAGFTVSRHTRAPPHWLSN
jgi:hypothetical protein